MEKYYSCYRDGTEGGKDMRSLASMYFILIWIAIFAICNNSIIKCITSLGGNNFCKLWHCDCLGASTKETYMNIIDTLIIENLALLALMLDKYLSEDSNPSLALFYAIVLSLFTLLPLLGLMVAISYRIVRRIRSELYICYSYNIVTLLAHSIP